MTLVPIPLAQEKGPGRAVLALNISRNQPEVLSGGFTPYRHLVPSSGRENTVIQLNQSSDNDDYLMNETRRPTTATRCPTLFDTWHGIFYIYAQSHRYGWTYQGPLFTMQSWTTGANLKNPYTLFKDTPLPVRFASRKQDKRQKQTDKTNCYLDV